MKTFKTLSRVEDANLNGLKLSLNEQLDLQESIGADLNLLKDKRTKINEEYADNLGKGAVLSLDSQLYFDSISHEISESIKDFEAKIISIKTKIVNIEKQVKASFIQKKSADNIIEKIIAEESIVEKNKSYDELDEYVIQACGVADGA